MENLVLLVGKIGVVIASFIGVATVVNWYHSEGGKKDGGKSVGHSLPSKNTR